MDLDQPVRYRGLNLNAVEILAGDGKKRGCLVEEFDLGNVVGIGYTEKRAQGDGMDASDVYLSARQIHLRGYVYGETRADAFDRLQDVVAAMSPTGAYAEDPAAKGYLPLEFDIPTMDLVNFGVGNGDGWRQAQVFARPRAQAVYRIRRDTGAGGDHSKGGAIEWAAELEAKDPRIYLREQKWEYFTGSESGSLYNRGDYPAPIDVLIDVAAGSNPGGTIRFQIGTADLTITVPPSTGGEVLRYSSTLGGILTLTANSQEALRMDLLSLTSNANRLIARPGSNTYTIGRNGAFTLTAYTRMMFNEAFA